MDNFIKISIIEFKKIISVVVGLVPSNSLIPSATCFLLKIDGDSVFVMANDLVSTISYKASIYNPSKCSIYLCVPPQLFLNTINSFIEKEIYLMQDGLDIIIKTDNAFYNITCYDGSDFPMPKENVDITTELPVLNLNEFIESANNILFASGSDSFKPNLEGVCLRIENGNFFLVASDSHTLAEWIKYGICKEDEFIDLKNGLLFPKKSLKQIYSIYGNFSKDTLLNIRYNKSFIFFDFGDVTISSRLSDHKFPSYSSLIPKEFINKAYVEKSDIHSVLKRISMYCDKDRNLCVFNFMGNSISMQSSDKSKNNKKADEKISCLYEGVDMSIGYNVKKIIDIVSNINNSEIIFKMNSPNSVTVLEPSIQVEGSNITMMLMPIMLDY